jgi:hypothetical protein
MTIDHPTQSNVKGKSKESQRKVKGKGNECLLVFYLQDKGKMLASYNIQNFIWHFEENK